MAGANPLLHRVPHINCMATPLFGKAADVARAGLVTPYIQHTDILHLLRRCERVQKRKRRMRSPAVDLRSKSKCRGPSPKQIAEPYAAGDVVFRVGRRTSAGILLDCGSTSCPRRRTLFVRTDPSMEANVGLTGSILLRSGIPHACTRVSRQMPLYVLGSIARRVMPARCAS